VNDTKYNEAYTLLGNTFCLSDTSTFNNNDVNDSYYLQPSLHPYQVAHVLNHQSEIASQHAFQVGLPSELVDSLLKYSEEWGLVDLLRGYTANPSPLGHHHNDNDSDKFVMIENREWCTHHFDKGEHSISPANEATYESILSALSNGGLLSSLLISIGEALNLNALAVYRLSFHGTSYVESSNEVKVATQTHGYKLMIPLLLESSDAELFITSDSGYRGSYRYTVNQGLLLGDAVKYGMRECDYRIIDNPRHGGLLIDGKKSGMRFVATLYIADLNEGNVGSIVDESLTETSFPLASEEWLMSQAGRHWRRDMEVVGGGRKAFRFRDELEDCQDRKKRGFCTTDEFGTRRKCLKTCGVYIEEGPVSVEKLNGEDSVQVCTQNRTGQENCKAYTDMDVPGQFVTPQLQPGDMFPIIWRETNKIATQYAFQIGFPPELITSLQNYCDRLGITDLFRDLVGDNPIAPEDEHTGRFVELNDGNRWYAQRPAKKWTSNMHWVSPADEKTHEEYLKVLAEGNFDLVLDAIGTYLGLEGLVAYHLTFIGVSHSEKGYIHHDSTDTGASVYNVIIPLILEDDSSPELVMMDDEEVTKAGALKYKIGMGALMGDDAMHGTEACDYRATKGMRMAATVYIADVNYNNAPDITSQTLTQIFPLPDARWLLTQAGRHWGDSNNHSLASDQGRKQFIFRDASMDCAEHVANGMCESGRTTNDAKINREKCLKSCNIYDDSLNDEMNVDDDTVDSLGFFFDSIGDDPSCVDENEDCATLAGQGSCMTDPSMMQQHGCRFSCLYCMTSESRNVLSLGEEQAYQEDEREADDLPSEEEINAVLVESERYFANEVLVFDEYKHVRLSCRNYYRECALWAAEGECYREAENYGWMQKNCPAACQDCLGVDPNTRCPVDYESNVFGPGDINRMFERWLEEAGQDVSSFSASNLPKGGQHPNGNLIVIASPYQDMMPLLNEEDKQFAHEFTPVPWVVAIENFLSDEECERLIELGADKYIRSTEYGANMGVDGTFGFVQSEGRTSTNTWCQNECRDDPMTKAVIERMVNMTGIPYDNYEDLQLVRYENGQFYQKHHDFADGHVDTQYGPRLLTFFLYLNDVEDGSGGTLFDDLKFAAQPKRGMALVWPSVVNDNPEEKDDWTWHEALPVNKGVKYGANAWIHLRDYQNVPDYC
jgi:prolyl 4-hydroxylase